MNSKVIDLLDRAICIANWGRVEEAIKRVEEAVELLRAEPKVAVEAVEERFPHIIASLFFMEQREKAYKARIESLETRFEELEQREALRDRISNLKIKAEPEEGRGVSFQSISQ